MIIGITISKERKEKEPSVCLYISGAGLSTVDSHTATEFRLKLGHFSRSL